MPKINFVKKAQPKYHTKPLLDPETGEQRVVVTSKTTKGGRPVTRALTIRDLDRPKPNLECDFPGCGSPEILPGQSYKFLKLRFGQKNRHAEHPDWQVWEYSSSVSAQAARLQADMHKEIDDFEFTSPEDFDALKESLAGQAEAFFEEREEAVENMPEQLQEGSQAAEYRDAAEAWKDEIEDVEAPEHDDTCLECEGTGSVDSDEQKWFVHGPDAQSLDEDGFDDEDDAQGALDDYLTAHPDEDPDEWVVAAQDDPEQVDCDQCGGDGTVDDQVTEEWADEAKDALRDAVDGV
jgi:hypothetical protein